jgi:uncharacterized protein YijF (DUF1287 family)
MLKRVLISVLLTVFTICTLSPHLFGSRVYTIVPRLNVRQKPSTASPIIHRLRHGRWVDVLAWKGDWLLIKLPDGRHGHVSATLVTDSWVKILKDERRLMVMKDKTSVQNYPAAFGFNPRDDKIKLGDGCTPEGRFYICEVKRKPQPPGTYGPVSLRISYPNIEDARRGLKDRIITKSQYHAIVRAVHKGQMPPQNTTLGGSIKIHGGDPGAGQGDWTLGCIAMNNKDLLEVFDSIPRTLTLVEIYRNKKQAVNYNNRSYVAKKILEESAKMIAGGCLYTGKATKIIPLSFPMGDFDRKMGVCTDVVIRALRKVKIDLQALLYEDILLHPQKYPGISRPNPNIDHRRTRNLKRFFDRHAEVLTIEPPAKKPGQWQPGDIVLMDTGIENGTIYDHIGIVSKRKTAAGVPLVINLWTIGWKLNEMELLNGSYPKIVGHYRLLHPFYYSALE